MAWCHDRKWPSLTYLRAAAEPDDEVEEEEQTNEDLAVFLDDRVLVTESSDDCFGAAELKNLIIFYLDLYFKFLCACSFIFILEQISKR